MAFIQYSARAMDHIMNPRNVGQVEHPDAEGEVENGAQGDHFRLSLRIEAGRILEARFLTQGCGAAIAAGSALTSLLAGISLEEARCLTNQDILKELDGLPPKKIECSLLAETLLARTLANYDTR